MKRTSSVPAVVRSAAFAYLVAVIMAIGSERMFWYWAPGLRSHLEVAGFYAIATATAIALMRRFRVDSWWSLMLVVPVAAYVVEGVITPVLYTGGPFVPFFPVWFTAWHGMLSLAVLVFVTRRLLLDESWAKLILLAVSLGLFWGAWSSTSLLPESVTDPDLLAEHDTLEVLDPAAFAGYAGVFTAVLIGGHAVIGFVWPTGTATSRSGPLGRGERALAGLVLLGATMWTFAVPWALPMFLAYSGVQVAALRRHRDRRTSGPDLLARLAGRVRFRALAPLVLMAPSAALTYAGLWRLGPSDTALRIVMYATIAIQTVAGAVVVVTALRRVRRGDRARTDSAGVGATSVPMPAR